MAEQKFVKTEKGTVLPLTNLKGKSYLMVAYRIQWMNEIVAKFDIKTNILFIDDNQTVIKASVSIYDVEGKLIKAAEATKRETKKDFPDHTEKAETGAIGRALALLGFGTQFALSDLDEGERLADSPLVEPPKQEEKFDIADDALSLSGYFTTPKETKVTEDKPKKRSSFKNPTKKQSVPVAKEQPKVEEPIVKENNDSEDGW